MTALRTWIFRYNIYLIPRMIVGGMIGLYLTAVFGFLYAIGTILFRKNHLTSRMQAMADTRARSATLVGEEMRKLALSTLVIMMAASCAIQKIVTSERHEVKKGQFNYQRYTPLDFLEYLGLRYKETIGEHGPGVITVVIVWNVPDSWISRKDVEKLANLLDSSERCAGTVMPISSHLPLSSTVGQEAAFLIEGFRKGKYPPAHSSDSIDKGSIRKWIAKEISTNK